MDPRQTPIPRGSSSDPISGNEAASWIAMIAVWSLILPTERAFIRFGRGAETVSGAVEARATVLDVDEAELARRVVNASAWHQVLVAHGVKVPDAGIRAAADAIGATDPATALAIENRLDTTA